MSSYHYYPPSRTLLAHDTGHLWPQVVYEDTQTYLKGKDPCAGDKLIFTALERVPSLFSIC